MRALSLALAAFVLTITSSPMFAQKQFGFDNRKSSGQPYLTPAETVAKFKVPPEFEVKLFAGEPQVVNPIAFTIDEKGRVWVVECFDYPKRAGKNVPRDRIVILEDTDGDGVCDKRTVFAEGKDFPVPEERKKAGLGAFDMASGIEVGHGGVFVGAPPYLWFIENKNDKPGKFDVLLRGFGSEDTHETLNTFQWGPDGWLYGLHGIYTQSNIYNAQASPPGNGGEAGTKMNAAVWRYHPRTKKFEIFAEGTSNPWGMDWRNTDGQFILACCVIPHLYHIVPGGVYRRQGGVSFNPYAYGYIQEICDHTFHKESGWAHAGLISLDVPHMPEKYRNSVIFGSIHGCSLKQNILKPNGSSFTASRGDNFLESGDKNVRPINLRWGPQGDIYMIDWHDQNPCHQAAADSWDYERGRVYRIHLKGTQAKKAEDLGKKSPKELVGYGCDGHPYLARTAVRLLDEMPAEQRLEAIQTMGAVFSSRTERSQQMMRAAAAITPINKVVIESLEPTEEKAKALPDMATTLIRFAGESGFANDKTIRGLAVIAKVTPSAILRRELASAAIRIVAKDDVSNLLHALLQHKEDVKDPLIPHLVWIAYEKLLTKNASAELGWLRENAPSNPLITDQIIPRTMRRLTATGQPTDLALCIQFIADSKDASVREKALEGLVTELAGRTVTAPANWQELRNTLEKDARYTAAINKLAVSFRDPAAVKRALEAATNLKLPVDARTEGIRQLAVLKPENFDIVLLIAMVRSDPEPAVRAEAVRALASFSNAQIPSLLLAEWEKYSKELRAEAINTLAGRKEWAKALLTAMAEKKVDRAAVSDNTILRIQAFKDKELDSLIEKAWGRTRATPAELTAVIDKTRNSLGEGTASFARGKLVFENNCAKCHKFEGRGADVGPPLDGAARDIEYIITNVLDPNRVIGAPYFLRIARLADGRVEQGVLAEEDDKFLTLKIENGVLKKIAKADLEGPVQVVEKSLMPEGLTGGMTPQDFRDLVRYLMAHPYLTDVTVNGEPKHTSVFGGHLLPMSKKDTTVIEAEVTAADDVATKLMLGVSADYDVQLDGKPLASGTGTLRPNAIETPHDIKLTKGTHRVTVVVKDKGTGGAVYARFLDPDRKLSYADAVAKK